MQPGYEYNYQTHPWTVVNIMQWVLTIFVPLAVSTVFYVTVEDIMRSWIQFLHFTKYYI